MDAAREHSAGRSPTARFGAAPVTRCMSNSDAEKVTMPSEWYASDPKDTRPTWAPADTRPLRHRYCNNGDTSAAKVV